MTLFSITLTSSITIDAVELYQSGTYGPLSIGKDSEERVRKQCGIIKNTVAPLHPGCNYEVILPEDLEQRSWALPRYCCVTWFVSDYVHNDAEGVGSRLAIIHFQDKIQPYFDSDNEARLKEIDWIELSSDFDY